MLIGLTKIGLPPPIGIGELAAPMELPTNATLLSRVTMASLPTNAQVAERTVMDTLPTNAQICERVTMDPLLTNAEILLGIILKTNANIKLRDVTLELPTNAQVAERTVMDTLPTSAQIAERTVMDPLPTNANLRKVFAIFMETNAYLSSKFTKELPTNALICERVTMASLLTGALLSLHEELAPELLTNAQIVERVTMIPQLETNAQLVDIRYYGVVTESGTEISLKNRVYQRRTKGFGLKTTELRIPGRRSVRIADEGMEMASISFEALFSKESDKLAFLSIVNNEAQHLKYFDGRSDRYFRVERVAVEPGFDEPWRRNFSAKVELRMEDPYLYSDIFQGLSYGARNLPVTTEELTNYGTAESPFIFTIGGFYSGGQQLTNIYVYQKDGSTIERTLSVAPQILSKEVVSLGLEEWSKDMLKHRYNEDLQDITAWTIDTTRSNANIAPGVILVNPGGYFQYCFQGHPLLENIQMVAKINVLAGSPLIRVSPDGINWTTAVATEEIKSGKTMTYYLTGSENKTTIYVRFACPGAASMSINSMDFQLLRDLTPQIIEKPSSLPGESRTLQIAGSGSAKAYLGASLVSRWYP